MIDDRVHTREDVRLLMASSIVVPRNTRPQRIVMYRDTYSEQYIVHNEYLDSRHPDEGHSCKFIHHAFEGGSYHPYKCAKRPMAIISEMEARYNAEAEFKERTRKLMERNT